MRLLTFLLFTLASVTEARPPSELISAGTPEEKGQALVQELARRNGGYKDLFAQVEMVLGDAEGASAKRAFTLKLLERATPNEGDRSLITFDAPADVRGTSVLSHAGASGGDDEQWLYLPSARRTKRISSANRSGSFVGSEFTFEDLTGNDARKYVWRFVKQATCGGESCFELEATPKDEGSAYTKRVLLLDANDLRIRSIAFFDRKTALLKTLTYDDYVMLEGKYLRSQRWTMRNVQTGKSTSIQFTAMKVGTGLTAADFSAGVLGR